MINVSVVRDICNMTATLKASVSQIQVLIKLCNMPQTVSKSFEK